MQMAATQFTKVMDGKRNFSSAAFIEELKAKSASFIIPRSTYEDCWPDELQKVFYYTLANGYFKDNLTLGLELVSLKLLKEHEQHSNVAASLSLPEGIRLIGNSSHLVSRIPLNGICSPV